MRTLQLVDERGGVAEEADTVIGAGLPVPVQRVVVEEAAEGVEVGAGAELMGRGRAALAIVRDAQGG